MRQGELEETGKDGKVGGVINGVLCKWWLLGLAVKGPWLGPGTLGHLLH